MKRPLNTLVGISLLSFLLFFSTEQKILAQDVEVSYQTFYDNLAPYGQWVSDPQYGNVWVPNESGDFRPYGSRGHWIMTDYGNTWVSEDPWGWACYHYGRWTYDPYYGWVWIPGYEWAPAWVSWRYGGGYCGWAPLGPGVAVGAEFNCPSSWWIFVGPQYMYSNDCYSHWRGPSYNDRYMHRTTIVNNYYVDGGTRVRYNYGPRADAIERDTHQPVQVYRVSQTNRPGAPSVNGNRVSLYRPRVDRGTANSGHPENVVQGPRQIGKPQGATTVNAAHQAPFRQDVQRQGGNNNNPGQRPGNNNQPPARNNEQPQPPAHNNNQPPARNNEQPQPPARNNNQPPARNNEQAQPPARNNEQPQPPARNNNPQPGNNNRPQPQHFNNPQPQPQPQRQQPPAPQPRPQQAPQPQPRPQQAQPQPRPMQQQPQPRPMPQQPRPAPQPQPRPAPAPHEEGGRR